MIISGGLLLREGTACTTDCTGEEVRRIYQERYRRFWNQPEWKALHAEIPYYPILDDHDIIDNWDSRPEHLTPKWQAVGAGGCMAYFDYQGSRELSSVTGDRPESFHYPIVYGHTAVFVMDLRSNRRAGDDGQLLGISQEEDPIRFLETHWDKKVLFILISVPVVHLPRFLPFRGKRRSPGLCFPLAPPLKSRL